MQSGTACFPVTALHSLATNGEVLLLVGQGPTLHVYDAISNRKLFSIRIFDVQAIHCIVSIYDGSAYRLAISGSTSIAIAVLETRGPKLGYDSLPLPFRIQFVVEAEDWILTLRCHSFQSDTFLALAANNVLLTISASHAESMRVLAQGPKSFLYAGDICDINKNTILSTGGSVFGEILVWTCKQDIGTLKWAVQGSYSLHGHSGSVFGVRISQPFLRNEEHIRLLASCSDDRTIRLWDISDLDYPRTPSKLHHDAVATGFGDAKKDKGDQIAMVWGHLSRIWGVEFLKLPFSETDEFVYIVSRGEDATCQIWSMSAKSRWRDHQAPGQLIKLEDDRYHFGKNVWALTRCSRHSAESIFTGGADGQVVQRQVLIEKGNVNSSRRVERLFKDVRFLSKGSALKQYLIINDCHILAATTDGAILEFTRVSGMEYKWKSALVIPTDSNTKLCSNCPRGVAIAASSIGLYIILDADPQLLTVPLKIQNPAASVQIASQHESQLTGSIEICLILTFTGNHPALVVWIKLDSRSTSFVTSLLNLPTQFVVTATCYNQKSRTLILGSRGGAIAVYRDIGPGSAPTEGLCIIKVHGSDSITSILLLPDDETRNEENCCFHFLTTGRDGNFAIHRASITSSEAAKVETIHHCAPPFGPNIEGALIVSADDVRSSELILYGFHSTNFVVWNDTLHRKVLSIECGGAHRSWNYKHDNNSRNSGGTFVWTKAGVFNIFSRSAADNQVTQTGGHGREIKAFAINPRPYKDTRRDGMNSSLIATGAEDTTIRLFSVHSCPMNDNSDFNCVSILDNHTTGVQHLAFSSCGNYLFSSAGSEELFVWRLTADVPCIGIGVILQDKMPKQADDSDARILNFDVQGVASNPLCFRIVAAYSNGKAKIMEYLLGSFSTQGIFRIVDEILIGTFCLTQVRAYHGDSRVIAVGTNGYLNLTAQENPFSQKAVGATPWAHQVHQSCILAMNQVRLEEGLDLVITGGDDNALGFTCVVEFGDNDIAFRTLIIPKAHAAALTALAVVKNETSFGIYRVVLMTVGNDQKVKIWELRMPVGGRRIIKDELLQSIRIKKLAETWSGVADVSNIGVIGSVPGETGGDLLKVVIVGVGMEILQILVRPCSSQQTQ